MYHIGSTVGGKAVSSNISISDARNLSKMAVCEQSGIITLMFILYIRMYVYICVVFIHALFTCSTYFWEHYPQDKN